MSSSAVRRPEPPRVLIPTALSDLPTPPPADAELRVLRGESMGTRWTVKLVAGDLPAARLASAIQAELDRVVAQMSSWLPASDLCRYNAASAGSWHALPEDFFTVLRAALALARDSEGAYDPAAGALVDLWGFGPSPRRAALPAPEEIAAALRHCGWRRLRFDEAGRRLEQPGGLRLDLSSIAKGHGVDLVCACLRALGVEHFLVEVGGELRGRGCKPDGMPWWVDVESPSGAEALPVTRVALHGLAVASSGDYLRAFEADGRRYSHTLDPRTGWPIAHGLAAVAVLHERCLDADALATALCVLGREAGLAYAERRGIAARFVQREPRGFSEVCSTAWTALLE